MSRQNNFLGHVIPSLFWDLSFNESTVLELTPEDPAYFATAVYERILTDPSASVVSPFETPPTMEPINEAGWSREIDCSGATPAVLLELDFLFGLCLVRQRGDKAHISKYAWVLYGPGGFFEQYAQAVGGSGNVRDISIPLAQLLVNYSLPGRYWWLREGLAFLYEGIHPSQALAEQMKAVQADWLTLHTFLRPLVG